MPSPSELADDLHYIRGVVDNAQRPLGMWRIYLVWAVIIPVGFQLAGAASEWTLRYWMVAAPVGGFLSFLFGRSAAVAAGHESGSLARQMALHWAGVGVALAAVGVIGIVHGHWEIVGPFFPLVVGLGWFLQGVTGVRSMMILGALLGVAGVVVSIVPGPTWSLVGITLGLAMLVAALIDRFAASAGSGE